MIKCERLNENENVGKLLCNPQFDTFSIQKLSSDETSGDINVILKGVNIWEICITPWINIFQMPKAHFKIMHGEVIRTKHNEPKVSLLSPPLLLSFFWNKVYVVQAGFTLSMPQTHWLSLPKCWPYRCMSYHYQHKLFFSLLWLPGIEPLGFCAELPLSMISFSFETGLPMALSCAGCAPTCNSLAFQSPGIMSLCHYAHLEL